MYKSRSRVYNLSGRFGDHYSRYSFPFSSGAATFHCTITFPSFLVVGFALERILCFLVGHGVTFWIILFWIICWSSSVFKVCMCLATIARRIEVQGFPHPIPAGAPASQTEPTLTMEISQVYQFQFVCTAGPSSGLRGLLSDDRSHCMNAVKRLIHSVLRNPPQWARYITTG
jgi:hypothetical protein